MAQSVFCLFYNKNLPHAPPSTQKYARVQSPDTKNTPSGAPTCPRPVKTKSRQTFSLHHSPPTGPTRSPTPHARPARAPPPDRVARTTNRPKITRRVSARSARGPARHASTIPPSVLINTVERAGRGTYARRARRATGDGTFEYSGGAWVGAAADDGVHGEARRGRSCRHAVWAGCVYSSLVGRGARWAVL